MSKSSLISNIQKEIRLINEQIDLRIINGEPYKALAKRHKMLLSKLWRLSGQSWFNRSFRFLTLF